MTKKQKMTNTQKADLLRYVLVLADHVIGGKPAFLPATFINPRTLEPRLDGVSIADMHDVIGDWMDDISSEEGYRFDQGGYNGLLLRGFGDEEDRQETEALLALLKQHGANTLHELIDRGIVRFTEISTEDTIIEVREGDVWKVVGPQ